jgi:phage regulator Rha-like protein
MAEIIELHPVKGEARVDSRVIARELGIQHGNLMETIQKHLADFEGFGLLPFKTEAVKKAGARGTKHHRYVLLNEDQAHFVLTLSRNTRRVVELKAKLVMALRRYRESRQLEANYLPLHHALHDTVKELADRAHQAGSTTPEELFHVNMNKLINRVFGLASGERAGLSPTMRAMITAAQAIATEALSRALAEGLGHREAYQRAKEAVERYAAGSLALIGRAA